MGIAARLIAVCLLAGITGCQIGNHQETLAPDREASPPSAPSITAFLDTIIQEWEGQAEFTSEFQRLTGTELDIVQPPHQQYNDRLLIQLASGDLPDLCEVLPEYLPQLVSDGIARPLESYIASSSNLKSLRQGVIPSVTYRDGHVYGFPARDGGGCVTYIRKDWLDNVGLPPPTDWKSFVQVLRAFTFNDPDRNGKNDTYGYTDVQSASKDWYNRFVFLNAHVEVYYDGAHWVDGFSQSATRQALERLRFLYEEGLIDPDFLTNNTFTARNKFFNGEVGTFTYWANHWARNLTERTQSTVGKGAEVIPIPAIAGARYIRRIGPLLVITSAAVDPVYVFHQFIDRQYDKGAVQTLFTYGVEGYHWTKRGTAMRFLPNPEDPFKAEFTKAFVPPDSILNDWKRPMPLDPLVEPAIQILADNPYQERLPSGGEYYRKYFIELERKLKPDIISRIVTGEYDIDAGLTLYRQRSAELFVEKILAEMNKPSNDTT